MSSGGVVVHNHARRGQMSPTYHSWNAMIGRCTRPSHAAYHKYGAQGVTVCERWKKSFISFLRDLGERPAGKTLDRIKNSRGYEPGNCRWATRSEQEFNKRNRSEM